MVGAAAATGVDWSALTSNPEERARARAHARSVLNASTQGQVYTPRFFDPDEWTTVRMLVDLIIPADARSGGASQVGVPEYIDFLMAEGDDAQGVAVRGGLAWLDRESQKRFENAFRIVTEAERRTILDDIAWPERAPPGLSHGVEFFNRLRDLTASGFWSSRAGVEDLEYMGNIMIPAWNGCPDAQLQRLGVQRPTPNGPAEAGESPA